MHGLKSRDTCGTEIHTMAISDQLVYSPPNVKWIILAPAFASQFGHPEISGAMVETAWALSKVLSTEVADTVCQGQRWVRFFSCGERDLFASIERRHCPQMVWAWCCKQVGKMVSPTSMWMVNFTAKQVNHLLYSTQGGIKVFGYKVKVGSGRFSSPVNLHLSIGFKQRSLRCYLEAAQCSQSTV